MTKPVQFFSVKETATRLGVTAKALRVYEEAGLVSPKRNAAGWRVYGPEELTRLHFVLALKGFGLTLADIGAVIGENADLAALLAMQEEALERTAAITSKALALIRTAREKLAAQGELTSDDLIALTKETAMSGKPSDPEMERLIDRHFSTAQKEKLHARAWTAKDQEAASQRWAALFAEAEKLRALGDPASPASA